MAEVVGLAASIVALLELTNKVITYVNKVRHANREAEQLGDELVGIQGLLTKLRLRADKRQSERWAECSRLLLSQNGPIAKIQDSLNDILMKFGPESPPLSTHAQVNSKRASWLAKLGLGKKQCTRPLHALLWPFKEQDVKDILVQIERYKVWAQLALADDSLALSQELSGTVALIQEDLVIQGQVLRRVDTGIRRVHSFHEKQAIILDKLQHNITGVQTHMSQVQEGLRHTNKSHDMSMISEYLQWLSPLKMWDHHHQVFANWQEGTGAWLLEEDAVQQWITGNKRVLFCHGIPGAGKSVLASMMIDHLWTKFEHDECVAVVFCYFNYKEREQHTMVNIIGSLLSQFAVKQICKATQELYEKHAKLQRGRPLDAFLAAFHAQADVFSKVYVIVDALDECPEVQCLLRELLRFQARPNVSLMVTSRLVNSISNLLCEADRIEIQARDEDIKRYLRAEIEVRGRLQAHMGKEPILLDEVVDTITEKSKGMFLLAKLHMEVVATKHSVKHIRKALSSLPPTLENTYELALTRINAQNHDDKELAMRILNYVVFAFKAFTARQLRHALAIEEDTADLEELRSGLINTETIIRVCAGLITVDHLGQVLLVHYTTQEYFDKHRTRIFLNGHRDMARCCLDYLCLSDLSKPCTSVRTLRKRLGTYPFLRYAATYWNKHVKEASELVMEESISRFFKKEGHISSTIQASRVSMFRYAHQIKLFRYLTGHTRSSDILTRRILLEARFGLTELLTREINNHGKAVLRVSDNNGQSLLSFAAESGDRQMVELLLKYDTVDLDTMDPKNGSTPLLHACEAGNAEVAALLLTKGANPLICKTESPLTCASRLGQLRVVELLLAHPAIDTDQPDGKGHTALIAACEWGQEHVAAVLLDRGANVNLTDHEHRTALIYACVNGNAEIVQLLLNNSRREVKVSLRDSWWGSALSYAVESRHWQIVQYLLDYDQLDLTPADGIHTLKQAAAQAQVGIVRRLLERLYPDKIFHELPSGPLEPSGGSILDIFDALLNIGYRESILNGPLKASTVDVHGRTVLAWAAQGGNLDIVKALLIIRDCESIYYFGRSFDEVCFQFKSDHLKALHQAALFGHLKVVEFLLTAAIRDPTYTNAAPDEDGKSVLIWAVQGGNVEIVKLLLDTGGCPLDTGRGPIPLMYACQGGHTEIVKLLLQESDLRMGRREAGFKLSRLSHWKTIPLMYATKGWHWDIVKIFLEQDDADPHRKINGITALDFVPKWNKAALALFEQWDRRNTNLGLTSPPDGEETQSLAPSTVWFQDTDGSMDAQQTWIYRDEAYTSALLDDEVTGSSVVEVGEQVEQNEECCDCW